VIKQSLRHTHTRWFQSPTLEFWTAWADLGTGIKTPRCDAGTRMVRTEKVLMDRYRKRFGAVE
jgi:hypothetical protein